MNKLLIPFLLFFLMGSSYNASAQTQLEMNETAHDSFKKMDEELNRVYKLLKDSLEKKDKELLTTVQKKWLAFRDSQCAFEAGEYEGGSMQPLIYWDCMAECTRKRIEDLNAAIEERKH